MQAFSGSSLIKGAPGTPISKYIEKDLRSDLDTEREKAAKLNETLAKIKDQLEKKMAELEDASRKIQVG